MSFLQAALDDPEPIECGRCASCRGKPVVSNILDPGQVTEAQRFLKRSEFPFYPQARIPVGAFSIYGFLERVPLDWHAQEGRVLSRWNDTGWGKMVADDKHAGSFRIELVEALAEMIEQRWRPSPKPQWITCVPSMRHPQLVPDFCLRLAARLGVPFVDVISKVRDNEPQKMQQNQIHQCRNLDGVFAVARGLPSTPVLLVDDMIDSGWTMTVLSILLRQAGAGPVFPVALSSTSSHG